MFALNQLQRRHSGRHQAGLSIVELMVGIAVGLIVVAGATVMVANQLGENRKLLLETQLQQDLRSAADIVTRELRRSGALPELGTALIPSSIETISKPDAATGAPVAKENSLAVYMNTPTSDEIRFDYAASTNPVRYIPGPYGFRVVNEVLETRVPNPTALLVERWEPLTDPNVMKVKAFTVNLIPAPNAAAIVMPCPSLCPISNDTSCWPTYEVRDAEFVIEAEATSDASVKRAITGRVRVRADKVDFRYSPSAGVKKYCPP